MKKRLLLGLVIALAAGCNTILSIHDGENRSQNGAVCTLSSDCTSGICIGNTCCESACSSPCSICGKSGTCELVTRGSDPKGDCPDGACNGTGTCTYENGHSCSDAADCLNDFCMDGYCCDDACQSPCMACNVPTHEGICVNLGAGVDDLNGVPTCSGTEESCNGRGVCKKEVGQACGDGSDCLTSYCVDGVCCDGGCTELCNACSVAIKGAGVEGICGPIVAKADPENECTAGACNGSGACALDNGEKCSNDIECLSGYCVDGVCCDNSCTGSCRACNLPSSIGACTSEAIDAPCGVNGNLKCNESGFCVHCTSDAQCEQPSNPCTASVCVGGACIDVNNIDGTVCNDNNSCTLTDVCFSGMCVGMDPNGMFCDGSMSRRKHLRSGNRTMCQSTQGGRCWLR